MIHVSHIFPNSYLLTISLSLFFFNLVPAPFLDGSEILRAVIQHQVGVDHQVYDLEAVPSIQRSETGAFSVGLVWQWIEITVAWGSAALLLSMVLVVLLPLV